MYNGIGLQTARGTGTNGYVQANLSNLLFSKNRTDYNTEADIAKAEAEVNRAPNVELLDHEYKRTMEIKCIEFEDLMEGKGFSEEEIQAKVDEYRKLLYNEFESGKNKDMDKELDLRNSHSRAKVAKNNRDRFRSALGIDASFVDGTSLEKIKKASEMVKAAVKPDGDQAILEKEMEKKLMEKLMKKMKKKSSNKANRDSSTDTSSSSSDSGSSDSSDSDSSVTSSSSSSTSSSEENRKARKRKHTVEADKKSSKSKSASHKLKEPKNEPVSPVRDSRDSRRRDEPREERSGRYQECRDRYHERSPKESREKSRYVDEEYSRRRFRRNSSQDRNEREDGKRRRQNEQEDRDRDHRHRRESREKDERSSRKH